MPQTQVPLDAASLEKLDATASLVRDLVESERKDGPIFQRAADGLGAGLDHESEDEIALFRPQLERARRRLDLAMTELQYTQDALATLRDDPALLDARGDRIEQLAKTVGQLRRQFIERVQLARDLDARVDPALESIRRGRRAAEVAIGALRLQVRGCVRTLTDALPEAEQLAAAARKALDRRDQKALTDARTKLIDLKRFDALVLRLRLDVQRLLQQHDDLARGQRADVQDMLDDLVRVEDIPPTIARLVQQTMALGQVPVQKPARAALTAAEVQKVIRAFCLPDDGSRRTKAAKVLADAAPEAWPRELAKVYGSKESELKARLGDVRKLPFVRAMSLIDI